MHELFCPELKNTKRSPSISEIEEFEMDVNVILYHTSFFIHLNCESLMARFAKNRSTMRKNKNECTRIQTRITELLVLIKRRILSCIVTRMAMSFNAPT